MIHTMNLVYIILITTFTELYLIYLKIFNLLQIIISGIGTGTTI